jgi:hypothetical protein
MTYSGYTKTEIEAVNVAKKAFGMDEFSTPAQIIRQVLILNHKPANDFNTGRKLLVEFAKLYKPTKKIK